MCNGARDPLPCSACAAWDWKGRSQESEVRSQKSGIRRLFSCARPEGAHYNVSVVSRKWLDNAPPRSAGILPAHATGTVALHCPLN
jgi:hypothetical protein